MDPTLFIYFTILEKVSKSLRNSPWIGLIIIFWLRLLFVWLYCCGIWYGLWLLPQFFSPVIPQFWFVGGYWFQLWFVELFHPWFIGGGWFHPWLIGGCWFQPWFIGGCCWFHPWFWGWSSGNFKAIFGSIGGSFHWLFPQPSFDWLFPQPWS